MRFCSGESPRRVSRHKYNFMPLSASIFYFNYSTWPSILSSIMYCVWPFGSIAYWSLSVLLPFIKMPTILLLNAIMEAVCLLGNKCVSNLSQSSDIPLNRFFSSNTHLQAILFYKQYTLPILFYQIFAFLKLLIWVNTHITSFRNENIWYNRKTSKIKNCTKIFLPWAFRVLGVIKNEKLYKRILPLVLWRYFSCFHRKIYSFMDRDHLSAQEAGRWSIRYSNILMV